MDTSRVQAQTSDEVRAGTLTFRFDDRQIEAPRVHTDVTMQVSGIIAHVKVRQNFQNTTDEWVEGVYAFPLPENAAVNGLRMQIGEREVIGEIREKADAEQLYQRAKANGQRASVVHQQRPNIFRTAVANIGPQESIAVTITYLQIVDQQAGRYSLRFPLTITPRYVPLVSAAEISEVSPPAHVRDLSVRRDDERPEGIEATSLADLQPTFARPDTQRQSVTFNIHLDAGVAVENIVSAHHSIRVNDVDGDYRVRLADSRVAPDRDFELAWTPIVHGEPAAMLFRERTNAGEHVLLMFMPPHERTPVATQREVIFIIDTSGSMSGSSMEQARDALLSALTTLTSRDRFTLIQFNSTFETLFDRPVAATAENIARARRYVLRLEAQGGTEMLPAMQVALSMPRSAEHLRQILFMTDGAVSNEVELMRAIQDGLGDARLFTVGIGSAPNGHFMRQAAQAGRGTFTFIGSAEQVEERMNELFRKLTHPVLTDISVRWPSNITPEYAPAQIGDLYADEPLVITARVPANASGTINITGRGVGVWTRQLTLGTAESRSGVAILWARNRVADLMDLQARQVPDADIRSQILPLALEYQIVSKYTSLVAIDKTPARHRDEPLNRTRIEATKPHGQNWEASGMPSTATSATLQLLIGIGALLLCAVIRRVIPARGNT